MSFSGWISAISMFLGAIVVLVAMIGLVRLPDVFCRSHALGKGLTLGLMLLLCGLWLDPHTEVSGLKVVAAIFFQFVTLPVASHLLSRLSYEKNLPRHRNSLPKQD
jgi:multicomponent Na+:H+ antiporter subunit G